MKSTTVYCSGALCESGIEGVIMVSNMRGKIKFRISDSCYGMQLAVIEYSGSVLGWKTPRQRKSIQSPCMSSSTSCPSRKKLLEEGKYGALSMRLGAYPAHLKKGSIAESAYGMEIYFRAPPPTATRLNLRTLQK